MMNVKEILTKERYIKSINLLDDADLMLLSKLAADGVITRFTCEARRNEMKRRGLI